MYKLEVWLTGICFAFVAITGGFLSVFFIIFNEAFFTQVPAPAHLVQHYGENMFVVKDTLMGGFPLHYILLIMFSWIGAMLVGAVWSLVMDKLEEKQQA